MTPADEPSFLTWANSEPFIFVSYARENRDFVYPEIKRLKAEGYRIWYDKDEIRLGRSWSREIEKAIEACSCFLVFITQPALDSDNVRKEIKQALSLKKHFIFVHWEKVELPFDLEGDIQGIQTLELYDLHTAEYIRHLRRALSDYVAEPKPLEEKKDDRGRVLGLTSSDKPDGISPKLVRFILILFGVVFFFLAIVGVATPFFGSQVPGDPLSNRLSGLLVGSFFLVIAIGLCGAAFAVHRNYLRRKNG